MGRAGGDRAAATVRTIGDEEGRGQLGRRRHKIGQRRCGRVDEAQPVLLGERQMAGQGPHEALVKIDELAHLGQRAVVVRGRNHLGRLPRSRRRDRG